MNDAETIVELGRKAATAQIVKTSDGREFLIVPDGFKDKEVTDPHGLVLERPVHIRQAVTLQTFDSLVDYTNRFKGAETVLFADIAMNTIAAVIDYHSEADKDAPSEANHAEHRAAMTLPHSVEWTTWNEISGKLMPQLEFARFIEENAADVTAPAGADLLEAIRDLQAHRKVTFVKAVRTSSDNENFEYTDETEARTRGGVEIPTKFRLGLPVYFDGAITELFAFLRWKLDDGVLTLGIKLHRAEHVRQAVFKQIVLDVGARTKCPVVFGKLG